MNKFINVISSFFSYALMLPIKGYRKFISPFLGNNCRYYPTCSEYALQALQTHGPIKGIILSIWRILRCNPFGKGGIDNIPPKGKWKS